MNLITKIRRLFMNATPFEVAHFFGYKSQFLEEVSQGYIESIKTLHADKFYCWGEREKAIISASSKGYTAIIEFLIGQGVRVDIEDNLALRNACRCGWLPIVKLLLEHGANPHSNSNEALKIASYCGYLDIVKLLISYGADPTVDNDKSMRLASQRGHFEIVKYYASLGINILTPKVCIDATLADNLDFLFYMKNLGFDFEEYDFIYTLSCFNASLNTMAYLTYNKDNLSKDYLLKITENCPIAKEWSLDYIKKLEYYQHLQNAMKKKNKTPRMFSTKI